MICSLYCTTFMIHAWKSSLNHSHNRYNCTPAKQQQTAPTSGCGLFVITGE